MPSTSLFRQDGFTGRRERCMKSRLASASFTGSFAPFPKNSCARSLPNSPKRQGSIRSVASTVSALTGPLRDLARDPLVTIGAHSSHPSSVEITAGSRGPACRLSRARPGSKRKSASRFGILPIRSAIPARLVPANSRSAGGRIRNGGDRARPGVLFLNMRHTVVLCRACPSMGCFRIRHCCAA